MAQLTINDTTLDVECDEDADKPALVLSHPLGADSRCWDALLPALRERYRIIRYDTRGHGRSTDADGPLSIETLGRDVVAILDHFALERAHFIGVSMGGAIGQWLLVHAPDRLEKVILANTAAQLGAPDVWNERIRSARSEGMAAIADATIERWFSQNFTASQSAVVDGVRETLRATSAAGYASASAALRDMDFRQALDGVNNPVLVLTGEDDPAVSDDDVAVLLAALPQARHVSLAARHMPIIEQPDAFADAALKFLSSRAAPAKPRGRPAARPTPTRARNVERRAATRSTASTRGSVAKSSPRSGARRAPAATQPSKAKPIAKRAQQGKTAARKTAAPVRKAAAATKARSAVRSTVPAAQNPTPRRATPGKAASAKPAARTADRLPRAVKASGSRSASASAKAINSAKAARPAKATGAPKPTGRASTRGTTGRAQAASRKTGGATQAAGSAKAGRGLRGASAKPKQATASLVSKSRPAIGAAVARRTAGKAAAAKVPVSQPGKLASDRSKPGKSQPGKPASGRSKPGKLKPGKSQPGKSKATPSIKPTAASLRKAAGKTPVASARSRPVPPSAGRGGRGKS